MFWSQKMGSSLLPFFPNLSTVKYSSPNIQQKIRSAEKLILSWPRVNDNKGAIHEIRWKKINDPWQNVRHFLFPLLALYSVSWCTNLKYTFEFQKTFLTENGKNNGLFLLLFFWLKLVLYVLLLKENKCIWLADWEAHFKQSGMPYPLRL